jgi:hypothetical protein
LNKRSAGIIILVISVIIAVAGLFYTTTYTIRQDAVNGIMPVGSAQVRDFFITFFGLGLALFGINFLIGKKDGPVTNWERLKEEKEGETK